MSNNDVELGVAILLNDMFSSGVGTMTSAMGSLGSVLQSSMGSIMQYSSGLNSIAQSAVTASQNNEALSAANSILSGSMADLSADIEDQFTQYESLVSRQIEISTTMEEMQAVYGSFQNLPSSVASNVSALTQEYNTNNQAIKSLESSLTSNETALNNQARAFAVNEAQMAENEAAAEAATAAFMQMSLAVGTLVGSIASFALFTAGLLDAVNEAASLQQALTGVQIALNLTNAQMVAVGQSITTIADNSVFSTTQIAQGFQMLGERGFNASQIMNGVAQSAVDFAEATGSQAAPAADLLGRTMQVFNATANQSKQYADALTFAFYNGVPSISELSSVIDELGGTASELNIPINQVVAALDYLTQNGLQASDAGNTLRYMMQALTDPTQQALDELTNLGLIVVNSATPAFVAFEDRLAGVNKTTAATVSNFDGTTTGLQSLYNEAKRYNTLDTNETFLQWAQSMGMLNDKLINSDGSFKDLFGIIQQVGTALQGKGLDQSQLIVALESIFNVESGKGADILFGNLNKTQNGINNLYNALQNFSKSGGAASDANKVTSNFNGAMQRLQTTIGSFMAQVGTPLLPVLTSIVGGFNSIVSTVSGGQTKVSTFGSVFLTTGVVLSGIAVIVGIAAAAFLLFDGALLPIIGIVAAVAAGIALLSLGVAAVVTWFKAADKPGSALSLMLSDLTNFVKQLATSFDMMFGPAIKDLQSAWSQFTQAIQPVLPILGVLAAIIGGALFAAFTGLVSMLGPVVNGLGKVLAGVLMVLAGAFNIVVGVMKFFILSFVGIVQIFTAPQKAAQTFSQALGGIGQAFQGAVTIVKGLGTVLVGLFEGVFGGIAAFIAGFVKGIISFFTNLADVLVGHSIIPDMVKSIVSWITKLPGEALSMIQSFVSNIINGAIGLAGSFHDKVLQPILDKVGDLIKQMPQLGVNILKNLASGIISAIASTIGNAMNQVGSFISSHLPHSPAKMGPLMKLAEQGAEIPNQIAKGIHGNVGVLGAAATHMGNVLSPQSFLHPGGAAYAGSTSGATTTVQFVMDSKVVSSAVIDHATGQLKMNGVGRTLK